MSKEIFVPDIKDLDSNCITVSDKQIKLWKWKEGGELKKREQTFANVYYGGGNEKLKFVVCDVRTSTGIQTSPKYGKGWMSVNLTDAQSEEIKRKIDATILQKCFDRRSQFLKRGARITSQSELNIMYQGVVREGEEKPDGSGERWNDSIIASVPFIRKGEQVQLDPSCQIEDLCGEPYDWVGMAGRQDIKEVVFEVDKITFDKDISVRLVVRYLVPATRVAAKITTKRKLQQTTNAESNMAAASDFKQDITANVQHHQPAPISTADTPPSLNTVSDVTTPPVAPKRVAAASSTSQPLKRQRTLPVAVVSSGV